MRRVVALLLIFGILALGCAGKKQVVERTPVKTVTPPQTPVKTPENATLPSDINKTLTDVNELLENLQEIENVSFNL